MGFSADLPNGQGRGACGEERGEIVEAGAGRPRVTVVGDDFVGALRILLDDLLNAARLGRATEFSFSLEFV